MRVPPWAFLLGKSMDKHQRYESEKSTWLHLHPDATQEQIEAACKAIAKRLGL